VNRYIRDTCPVIGELKDKMAEGIIGFVGGSRGINERPCSMEQSRWDTGCGIAEENIGRLFTPFFTTKEKGEGVGLGLAVAYGIIRRYGGDICIVSSRRKGTTFSIFLGREGERKKEDDSGDTQ